MKKTKLNPKHLYAIFAFLLSAVVVFCGVQIWQEYSSRQKDIDAFAELSELAEIKEPDEPKETAEPDTDGDAENSDTDSDTQEEQENPVLTPRHDIPLLISQNSDCIGWITIDNTAVDYPVMHTPEWPQKYLRMNFYQQYSDSGVPFLDYRCTLDSDNLIIFGHNMRNGTMFSTLKDYLNEGRLASDPTILLETEDGVHEFTIFAVACVDKLDSWYSFINAESEDAFNEAVQRIIQNAYYTNGDAPEYGDRLLTLSTCYGSTRSSRLIIIAKEEKANLYDQRSYRSMTPLVLDSIKYTGDKRYLNVIVSNPLEAIESIFRVILPEYGFAVREEQIKLSMDMYRGLVGKQVAICEAEVGTGKTMAYLVASFIAKQRYAAEYGFDLPVTISKNITWSYRKNFEDGKPIFMYKKLLGYRKGEDGEPEIVPQEAEIVERIYTMYLSGMTVDVISKQLQSEHIEIPGKKFTFGKNMVMNVLKNEKYCGDCILQKTVTIDCISKTRKKNEGEAPMYIVENSHPAIISREMFNRTQEELSKRKARSPQSQKTAITATGKYSKYALTDVLICAECGSRYKRVTWTSLGQKRIVWRCVNRLDNGKKYCHHSPTLSETALQEAIVRALNKFNDEDTTTYLTLMKATIGEAIGANGGSDEIDLLERRIEALNNRMLKMVSESVEKGANMEDSEDEFKSISDQIEQLNRRIQAIRKSEGSDEERQERLRQIQATIDERSAHRDAYDDSIVRQMIECIKVYEGGKLKIIFGGAYEVEEQI